MIDHDYSEEQALRLQDRRERAYLAKLGNHPDCRDPDHPGCHHCMESEDDDSEQPSATNPSTSQGTDQ